MISEKAIDMLGFIQFGDGPTFEDCVKEMAKANGRSMTTDEARQMVQDFNRKCEEMKERHQNERKQRCESHERQALGKNDMP